MHQLQKTRVHLQDEAEGIEGRKWTATHWLSGLVYL